MRSTRVPARASVLLMAGALALSAVAHAEPADDPRDRQWQLNNQRGSHPPPPPRPSPPPPPPRPSPPPPQYRPPPPSYQPPVMPDYSSRQRELQREREREETRRYLELEQARRLQRQEYEWRRDQELRESIRDYQRAAEELDRARMQERGAAIYEPVRADDAYRQALPPATPAIRVPVAPWVPTPPPAPTPGLAADLQGPMVAGRWSAGMRIPAEYLVTQFVVRDWQAMGLTPPPRGYQWLQVDPEYVLVDMYTGALAQVVTVR